MMTEEEQGRRQRRSKLWMISAALAVIVAVIVIPPLVSINRYKARITHLMSASLGRPVRLSSVELRLFPRPGFVLTDLIVDEDPSYGAEPVLHASTVRASIRLLPLWKGKLEISRISVDEASLNLVRTTAGRWNLDPFFRTATQSQSDASNQHKPLALPYLEATNSRINIKQGSEKLPFSIVSADLSFWQENPGDWRVRLRGQPARTDVSLDLADTGILQLEARLLRAPELRQMPMHLDLEWRDAQLGQLSKLILGSDSGWRGDLTGEVHLDGTPESAQVKTRLRAIGVHRAEFAPAAPLDFDANCGFIYHYSERNLEGLVCDSPLGDGHVRVEGDLPSSGQPKLTLQLQRIPTQAGLDALRTVRNKFGAGLEAKGTISGKLTYDPGAQPMGVNAPVSLPRRRSANLQTPKENAIHEPLSGSLIIDGLGLTGVSLNQPVEVPRIVLEPSPASAGQTVALNSTFTLSAGGATPLGFALRLALSGYQLTIRGAGAVPRMRELANAAGLPDARALNAIAGEPITLDLAIAGPWLPSSEAPIGPNSNASLPGTQLITLSAPVSHPTDQISTPPDQLTGTVILHNDNWKFDALSSAVQISQGTLHLGGHDVRWDPVAFSFGPIKGTATLEIPAPCEPPLECQPHLDLQFATIDAAEIQSTLLGARKSGSLLSSVIERLSTSSAPSWPRFDGRVKAASLLLGTVTLHNAVIALRVSSTSADLPSVDAGVLGGQIHATGTLTHPEKPIYSFEAQAQKLSPVAVCQMFGLQCKGSTLEVSGKVDLSGFADKDLATSATGKLHFEWQQGAILGRSASDPPFVPAALGQFDLWVADGDIANSGITLRQSQVQLGSHKFAVDAAITFADPPRVTFPEGKSAVPPMH
jgi:AsmA family